MTKKPLPRLSPLLTKPSRFRKLIYETLLDEPRQWWSVSLLATRLPGVSAESIRATLYLLEIDRVVEKVAGQHRLTFRLTHAGATALRALLDHWCGAAGTPLPTQPHT